MIGMQTRQSKLIASLLKREAYPHPVSSIELIETHISWVILTGSFAYKIKKSLHLDFLDFSTLERRLHFCEEELRLNRRMAPSLYLAVVPICNTDDKPSVGGKGDVIEYALKMQQFPQSAQLDEQIDDGLLNENDMQELAQTIAAYHRDSKRLDYRSDKDALQRIREPVLDNFAPIVSVVDMEAIRHVQEWVETSLRELESTFIQRRKNGFVRECHGDLHLANLVRLTSGIVAFDCIEFCPDLRNIDVISDVAFLVMDLVARARQDLAAVFINRYLECTGDYGGMAVFGLYFVHYCMVRAKVAAIRSGERDDESGRLHDIEQLKHYLAVAVRWISQPKPRLIAMHGYSGSGKTWLSSQLLSALPAIRVRSDIERKRNQHNGGVASVESPPGRGAYTERARSGVYEDMARIVEGLLIAGFDVIADASFLKRTDRDLFRALADKLGVSLVFVDANANKLELARRLQRRNAEGDDVSDASTAVLRYQQEHAEALNASEHKRTVHVATDGHVDSGAIIKKIRQVEKDLSALP